MTNKLQEFFIKFFNNLGCDCKENENSLIISNIPQNFEKFSGKKSPYYLSFDSEKEGYEFISQNHYLLRAMKEFLEGRGETTLLKINIEFNPEKDLPKIIPFRNSKIKSVTKHIENNFIFKFSFGTTFRYLSEKENLITPLYVQNKQLINFDESLSLNEGKKREIKEVNLKEEYSYAKSKLQEFITPKIDEVSLKLNDLLKSELTRVKEHYKTDLKEFTNKKENLLKQIKNNEEDLEKRKKFEKMLENLLEEKSEERLKKEEENFLDHETKKHSLSIKSKLMNTSIIYFPIYKLNLVLELGNKNLKIIELVYNSFKKNISPLHCQSCNKEINEIILCSSGHLTCRECGNKCKECGEIYCKRCVKKKCSECSIEICSQCINVCEKCKKVFCKSHINNFKSGRKLCKNCVQKCSKCGLTVDSEFVTDISGRMVCLKCANQITKQDVKEFLKKDQTKKF
jgi:hypothetical protein